MNSKCVTFLCCQDAGRRGSLVVTLLWAVYASEAGAVGHTAPLSTPLQSPHQAIYQ